MYVVVHTYHDMKGGFMRSSIRRLLYTAYGYFTKGEPFPIDLMFELWKEGIKSETLQTLFEEGLTVPQIAEKEL